MRTHHLSLTSRLSDFDTLPWRDRLLLFVEGTKLLAKLIIFLGFAIRSDTLPWRHLHSYSYWIQCILSSIHTCMYDIMLPRCYILHV